MKSKLLSIVFLALVQGAFASVDYTDRVNLFLGTNSSAQCSPSAIRPFGMVSRTLIRRTCPGYQNRKQDLRGFNHTHLQGTVVAPTG